MYAEISTLFIDIDHSKQLAQSVNAAEAHVLRSSFYWNSMHHQNAIIYI